MIASYKYLYRLKRLTSSSSRGDATVRWGQELVLSSIDIFHCKVKGCSRMLMILLLHLHHPSLLLRIVDQVRRGGVGLIKIGLKGKGVSIVVVVGGGGGEGGVSKSTTGGV